MSHFIRIARELAKTLPILLALGGTALAPPLAFANNQGPGGGDQDRDGRGDKPERKLVSIQTLKRMSKPALRELSYESHRLRVDGVMGKYSPARLILALQTAPGRTGRLIERIENTRSQAERRRIVNGLLQVHSQRFVALDKSLRQDQLELLSKGSLVNLPEDDAFGQTSSDPQVEALYRLRDEYIATYNYVELLKAMRFADYWDE